MAGYGVMWQEFKGTRIILREQHFETDQLREKFVSALTEKENFYQIISWSGVQTGGKIWRPAVNG